MCVVNKNVCHAHWIDRCDSRWKRVLWDPIIKREYDWFSGKPL